jgi:hypothetical protein
MAGVAEGCEIQAGADEEHGPAMALVATAGAAETQFHEP